jgi:hypothetical protein
MRVPLTIVGTCRLTADEAQALADSNDNSCWCSPAAALLIPRGHLRDRNGGEGGIMHSSCSRLPHTNETGSEMSDVASCVISGAQPNAFLRGLIWAVGLSAIFWAGFTAAFV